MYEVVLGCAWIALTFLVLPGGGLVRFVLVALGFVIVYRGVSRVAKAVAEDRAARGLGPRPEVAPPGSTRPGLPHDVGVVAPAVLTGEVLARQEQLPEGWYPTADGTLERYHNGVGWTAHERAVGTT